MTRKLLAWTVLFFAVSSTAQVQSTFFGFNWGANDVDTPPHNNPWPTAIGSSFGRARNWGTPTGWQASETSRCASPCDPSQSEFDWSNLDDFMTDILTENSATHVEITTGGGDVPCWANGTTCSSGDDHEPLPTDAGDSTTTCNRIPSTVRSGAGLFKGDCQWQEFVYALAEHECTGCNPSGSVYQGTLKFRSLSSGNEVNTDFVEPACNSSNTSTCNQLIKMQADACLILRYVDSTFSGCATPSFTNSTDASYYLGLTPGLINPPPITGDKAGDFADVAVKI
jgi:hypothetical protein